jgi:hypothetical protein
VFQVLNCCIAACGGVFVLSLFGQTDSVTFVPQPIVAVQRESYGQMHRPSSGIRTLRSSSTRSGDQYA